MLSYFEFNIISKLFMKLEKTVYKLFLWTEKHYLNLVHPFTKNEILEDLGEVIMINREYLKNTTLQFFKQGFNMPYCLDGTQTQQYLFESFENFWRVPENRIGNEKLGFYTKKVYFEEGPRILKRPRDRLNKFDNPLVKQYLRYSENLIYSLLIMLIFTKQSKSSIINYYERKGIPISKHFLNELNGAWIEVADGLMKDVMIPTNIHTIFIDATYTKTNIKYINKYDPIEQKYYYVNHQTGEVIYTDHETWTITKEVCILRAYGRTFMSNKTYSLGYIIRDSENVENYTELLNMIKEELHIENPVIICADGHKAIPSAIKEVYPNSKQQLCLVHLQRELRNEFKSKYLKKKIDELFKVIKTVETRSEAENKVYELFDYFQKISNLYERYLNEKSEIKNQKLQPLNIEEYEELLELGISNASSIFYSSSKLQNKLEQKFDSMFAFLEVPKGKERISYTTNCIENGNKIFKSFIRNKGPFYGIKDFIKILNFLHFINNNT